MYKYRSEDTVTFYLKPKMAKSIIKWSRFTAIFSLISASAACATLVGIPLGIVGIIAALKIIRACTDLDAYIKTGKMPYSESAGNNFFEYFKNMKKYYMISLIVTAVIVIAVIVLCAVYFNDIMNWLERWAEDFWGDYVPDEDPNGSFFPLLISQTGKFFHRT